jgi:hypothetical protein
MKTVPLHGKKAAGRVALVDDENYDLVSQYRWFVYESAEKRGRRKKGPYAIANSRIDGRHVNIFMHCLIMGFKGVDHIDHDGLNNQRYNLRPATTAQNNRNTRGWSDSSSSYKGVSWDAARGLWSADIYDGRRRQLGRFVSELQAAYVYDDAAREAFGEFACTNFSEGPTQAMLGQWEQDREERRTAGALNQARSRTCACQECGGEFQSTGTGRTMYCADCKPKIAALRNREYRARKKLREQASNGGQ